MLYCFINHRIQMVLRHIFESIAEPIQVGQKITKGGLPGFPRRSFLYNLAVRDEECHGFVIANCSAQQRFSSSPELRRQIPNPMTDAGRHLIFILSPPGDLYL